MGVPTNIDSGGVVAVRGRRLTFLALVTFLVIAAAGCSGADETGIVDDEDTSQTAVTAAQASQPAGAVAEPANQDDDGNASDEPTATSLALIASPTAEDLQDIASQLAPASLPASQFIADADGSRLDQLGDSVCSELPDEPTVDGLTSTGRKSYDETLTEDERELIDQDDWAVAFAAIVRTYCPDQFPPTPAGASQSLVDQYRIVLDPSQTSLPEETREFIDTSSNERLEELQASACSDVNPTMDLRGLAAAIEASYNDQLTEAEQAQLTPSGYGELYLDLVGFFCFENVPQ